MMTQTTPTSPADPRREPRSANVLVLQVLRLPAALALLTLVGLLRPDIAQTIGLYGSSGVTFATAYSRMVVAAFALVMVVAVGRHRRAPGPLLTVEAVVAAALGFTPPFLWTAWLNHHPLSWAIASEFVAPLAIAWFAVCALALVVQQLEPRRAALPVSRPAARRFLAMAGAWLPWLRLPALIVMLLLVAAYRRKLGLAWSVDSFTAAWVPLTLAALAFMVIAVVPRHRAPWPLLAVEMVVAVMLAFTPRFQWLTWLGMNELTSALASEFTAPLAIAWFAVALIAGYEGLSRNRRVPSG